MNLELGGRRQVTGVWRTRFTSMMEWMDRPNLDCPELVAQGSNSREPLPCRDPHLPPTDGGRAAPKHP